jgi:hypothetical protein
MRIPRADGTLKAGEGFSRIVPLRAFKDEETNEGDSSSPTVRITAAITFGCYSIGKEIT